VLFGITATLGPALGTTVGGWLTDHYGGQWVFYINLVPGALMIGSIVFAIRSAPMQLYQLREGDWLGIGCMGIGLGSLIAMLEEGQRDDLGRSSSAPDLSVRASFDEAVRPASAGLFR